MFTLIIIAILVFILLIVVLSAASILGGTSSETSSSILIKDNTLKYDSYTKEGKRIKKSFNLTKINNYLKTHKEINIIENYKLYKENQDKPCNANNLIVENDKHEKLSLKKLSSINTNSYNNVCKFLDLIHDKDDLQLDFRLRRYVNQSNNLILIENNINSLKQLKTNEDNDINKQIDLTIEKLTDCKDRIDDINKDDQLRKLNDYYIKMLIEIVSNYKTIKTHDTNKEETHKTKQRIFNSFELINKTFDSLYIKEESSFDVLEAEVSSLRKLAEESNQLLEKQKELYK